MDSNTNNNNEVKIFSGSRPYPGSATGDTAYTSADGLKVYIQFIDPDSTGLYPSSGIQSRFRVTKLLAGAATTVTPVATFVDSSKPKLLELQLNSSRKCLISIVDEATNKLCISMTRPTELHAKVS